MKVKALLVLVLVITFVFSCEVTTEPDLSVPQVVFEDEFDDYWPSLSPDGRYLAFLSDRDGEYPHYQWLLCVYDFETNQITTHTDYYNDEQYNLDILQVEWSTDGQWLFFCREYAGYGNDGTQLCRIPLGGNEQDIEVLKENIYFFTGHPDGLKLVVRFYEHNEGAYLAELDISSRIMTPIENTADTGFRAITYAQDGESVFANISTDDAPLYGADVVLFPIDGSEPQGIVNLGWEGTSVQERLDLSPSGDKLIFSDQNEAVTVFSTSGGEPSYPVPTEFTDPRYAAWEDDGFMYFCNDGAIWRFKPEL